MGSFTTKTWRPCRVCRPSGARNGHRCFLLQARTWSHQDQWLPDRARRARDPALQSVRAGAAPRLGSLLQRGYPYSREGRRFHLASLRHPPGDREVACGLLPEVRRRGPEEGHQGYPPRLRPLAPRGRPASYGAEEVRWPLCPCPLPEVVPLSVSSFGGVVRILSLMRPQLVCES